MAADEVGAIDDGWWPIISEAVARAAQEEPFGTLVAVLVAATLLTIVPVWLMCHYRFLGHREAMKVEFEKVRKTGNPGD